ncbi:cadherin-like beta sandwich domain-containing protein [Paenibacillus sinopodophylli]|uniref:cadherin-like beta sandwich domain-containing protein n=1 Tax=Paenibacillus sinopodophylli TaxID=1837342 RepID=UPI001486C39D|nr:cadherin-like beta sandwich domain-containing protein [Paenibacillus sinopodophylli]
MNKRFVRMISMLLAVVLFVQVYPAYPSRSEQQVYAEPIDVTGAGDTTPTDSTYEPETPQAPVDKLQDYSWEKVISNIMPSARMGAAMAFDEKNGKVVMFGGKGISNLLKDNFLWDGVEKKWQKLADSSVPGGLAARRGAAITYDPALEKVVMFGGEGASGVLNDMWVWNGQSLQWQALAISTPPARAGASLSYDGENLVLFGGYTLSGSTKIRLADTWVFDGTSWEEKTPEKSPPATHSATMAYDGKHAVLYGGNIGEEVRGTSYQINSNKLWIWDGTTWDDSAPTVEALDWGRWGQAMAYDGRRVVFYGGEFDWINPSSQAVTPSKTRPVAQYQDSNGNKAAIGWDGTAWSTWVGPSKGPGGGVKDGPGSGTYMSMAYDGNQFVLFGGFHEWGGLTNETFTFGNEAPVLPTASITSPPVILMDKIDKTKDMVKITSEIKGKAMTEIGIEYREVGETAWEKKLHDDTEAGAIPFEINGLKWQVDYEARVYAKNPVGTAYSAISTFKFYEDPAMVVPDLRYDRSSPSVLHSKDKKRIVVVGEGITNLWRKPADQIHYALKGKNGTLYPLTTNVRNNVELELNWTDDLPDGKYDLELNHDFYNDFIIPDSLLITSTGVYEPRDYNEIAIPSTDADNEDIEQMIIRGPFTEKPDKLGVFELNKPDQVIMLNEYIKFKGTNLTIDKSGEVTYVEGFGRLYVEKAGIMYTLFLGEFEFNSDEFSIEVAGDMSGTDYLSLNLPVNLTLITFINGGVRLGGDIKVDFTAGTTNIKGNSEIEALEFKRDRFDFAGQFNVEGQFETGPLEGAELRFRLDTRVPLYGAGGSFDLRKQKVGFEADILFKRGKLDSLSFGVRRKIKLGSTGAQLTRLGGGFSGLASQNEVPFTLKAFGGASDAITPEIKGYNMVNGNNLSVGLSRYHFEASGELAVYWVPVANLDFMTIWNAAGFKEYSSPGFRFDAKLNLVDVVVGQVFAQYFANSGYAGFVSARVQIPRWVSVIGGKSFGGIDVGVNNQEIFGSVGSGWFGGSAKYMFKPNSFDFSLGASKDMKREIERMKREMVKPAGRSMARIGGGVMLFSNAFANTSFTPLTNPLLTGDSGYSLKLASDVLQQAETGVDTSATGRITLGQFTAVLRDNTPEASFTAKDEIQYALKADHDYEALLVLDGKQELVKLVDSYGTAIGLDFTGNNEANNRSIDAVYLPDADKTYVRLQLKANIAWKLVSSESQQVELYELTFLNKNLTLSELAGNWAAVSDSKLTAIDVVAHGLTVLELDQPKGDLKLYKPDGREYELVYDTNLSSWNSFLDPITGKLNVMIDVAQTGEWLLDSGERTSVSVYVLGEKTTTQKLKDWKSNGQVQTEIYLGEGQSLIEIEESEETAVLSSPDGTVYPLQSSREESNWNAYYEADKKKWTILVEVDKEETGNWIVQDSGFVTIRQFVSNAKYESLLPFFSEGSAEYETSVQIDKQGRYMFMVTGGSRDTQIIAPNVSSIPLVFQDENENTYNAVLQEAVYEDETDNEELYGDMTFTSNLPFVKDNDLLSVGVDVEMKGKWTIRSSQPVQVTMYELDPIAKISEFNAEPMNEGLNSFKVKWNVKNAKPGTKVSLMVTDLSEKAIGPVILKDLPTSGVQIVDIPEQFMPGQYWLSMVADGEDIAPLFAVTKDPVELKASVMLPQPKQLAIASTGNGEITLRFPSIAAEGLEYYQLTVSTKDEAGNPVTETFGVDPMDGEWQEIIIAGYESEQSYSIQVMAVGELDGNVIVSPVSDSIETFLPAPKRANLELTFDTAGAKQKTSTYKSYDEQEEIMVNTAAEQVIVNVKSDQAAEINLYVNGELMSTQSAQAGGVAAFNLNQVIHGAVNNAQALEQRDYTIEIEAINDRGDYSFDYRKLYIDRTEPFLYAAGQLEENGKDRMPLNGQVVYGSRLPIIGQTEIGATLTVDGRSVPVNSEGKFNYFAPIGWNAGGVHTVIVIAEDEVGNTSEYHFDVVKGTETDTQAKIKSSDLAALELDQGMLSLPFHPDHTGVYKTVVEDGKVRLYAVAATGDAAITVNNKPLDAAGYVELDAPVGDSVNSFQIKVTGADSSTKTYVVEVHGKPSEVAVLKNLSLFAGTEELLTEPTFNGAQDKYNVYVENGVSTIKLTSEAYKQGSVVQVYTGNETNWTEQTPQAIPVQVGVTTVKIKVTAPNGKDFKEYDVSVIRAQDSNAQLEQLTLNGGKLTRAFEGNETEYQVIVPAGTSAFSIAARTESPTAVMRLANNGDVLDNGLAYSVALTEGIQTVQLDVTAEDGTEASYKLVVLKQSTPAATAPYLSELKVDGLDLLPEFSSNKLSYGIDKKIDVTQVTLSAKSPMQGARLTVNGVAVNQGEKRNVRLAVGSNYIVIGVESADRSSSRQYAVEVVRMASTSVPDRSATVAAGDTGSTIANVIIRRSVTSGGVKIDTVNVPLEKANEIIKQVTEKQQKTARIVITDLANDRADELKLNIPSEAIAVLSENGISLIITTPNAELTLSADTIRRIKEAGIDLYFRIVPIRTQALQQQAQDRLLNESTLKQLLGGRDAAVLGVPTTIETNYKDSVTRIVLPLTGVIAARDSEAAKELAAQLAVYIEHSDGEKVLKQGTLLYDEQGNVNGYAFEVTKFSLFTLVRLTKDKRYEPYISGYPDGTFRPAKTITRAELASVLAKELKLDAELLATTAVAENGSEAQKFTDVPANHWAAEAITLLKNHGIMNGDEQGKFRPGDGVTRAELAAITARWNKLAPTNGDSVFKDLSGHWAADAVNAAQEAGMLQGYPDGTFRPNKLLLRGEAVRVLNAVFKRPIPKEALSSWPDVSAAFWASQDIASASGYVQLLPDGQIRLVK